MDPASAYPKHPKLFYLQLNKEGGYNYRKRREEDWLENYTLYRDRVIVNRLTQRQSVNVPLMKQQIRTLLKDVDDMPVIEFQNYDLTPTAKEPETFLNEYWKLTLEDNKMEIKDIIDKKQVFLFGRSFDQIQIIDGKIAMTIEDPQDILVDRYTDPADIDSSRFLIHVHIFKPFSYLEKNPNYDQEAVKRLKDWYATDMGLLKAADNADMLAEKNRKMAEMGVSDVDAPVLGETIVELSLHFNYDVKKKEDSEEEEDTEGESYVSDEEEELFLTVEADDMEVLLDKPLEEIIGKTKDNFWRKHYPYNTWADDVERQDFWSDAVADIIRGPNKIVNSEYSQEVESRTLANFGMNYYDGTKDGFVPQTYQPQPFGWYSLPGKPDDIVKKVDIQPLQGNIESMNFIIGISEKGSGATANQAGVQTERKTTLGEVELNLGEAKERIKGMSKFYTPAWKDRARKFLKIVEAGSDKLDAVEIHKKGRNTDKMYTRTIEPKDWHSELGYGYKVWSQDEKNMQDTKSLEKMNALKSNMPDNPKVDEIFKRKLTEFADLTPEETQQVMEFEMQKMLAIQQAQQQAAMMGGMGGPGMPDPAMGGAGPQPLPPQGPAPTPQNPNNQMMVPQ